MPQLDFLIAFPQIFWLIIIFFSLHTILVHFFLPNFIKLLKVRKKVVLENSETLSKLEIKLHYSQSTLNKIIIINFSKIKILLEKELNSFFVISGWFNSGLVDKKIASALYHNIIYYDTNIIESIPIKLKF